MTLDDPELTLNSYYALCCITHMSFRAHHKNLNEDRPILSATEMTVVCNALHTCLSEPTTII